MPSGFKDRSEDDSFVGRILGHYRILAWAGGGGMGEVYLAEDTRLRRRVALKLLPPAMAQAPERLARFEMEAKLIAALNHPSIVTLYSIEEAEGHRFLTMEYVDGKTLAESMPAGGLPIPEFLKLAIPLAEALGAAHAQGVIHRDLKPSNIMVTRDGRVKILDFGVGKLRLADDRTVIDGLAEPSLTREGVILGTPRYMSPEQVQGKELDHRSDLFSLGIIFYEMLTGRRPFAGENSAQIISSLLRDGPPPLADVKREASGPLAPILDHCLAKEPEERYSSALDLVADLREAERQLTASTLSVTGATAPTPARAGALAKLGTRRVRLFAAAVGAFGLGALLWYLLAGPEGAGGARGRHSAGVVEAEAKPSLAVLPLGNFTGEAEYFVDGMTDSLITALARIKGLRVISRQSVMRFKDSKQSLPEIAKELGVAFVVAGSVQRAGDRVQMTTELIQPNPEEHLWTETYDRGMSEVLAIPNEVAQAIARAIRVQVSQEEKARLPTDRKVNPECYEEYLRGRFHWNLRTAEGLKKAIEHFNQALTHDPTYAPAYSGLADSFSLLGYLYENPTENYARAKAAAQKALELDDDLAQAHTSMGMVNFFSDWNWQAAETELRRAIDLDPSYATAHHWYWSYLAAAGRFDEAEREIAEAQKLDPLSQIISANFGMQYYLARRFDDADAQLAKTLELHPQFATVHLYRGWVFEGQKRHKEAVESFLRYFELIGQPQVAELVRPVLAKDGEKAAYGRLADELVKLATEGKTSAENAAWFLTLTDRRADALTWLQTAAERRASLVVWIGVAANWDGLRSDPRYQALARRIGVRMGTN